jgi:hypothetical protein
MGKRIELRSEENFVSRGWLKIEDGGWKIEDPGSRMEDRRSGIEARITRNGAIFRPRSSILDPR